MLSDENRDLLNTAKDHFIKGHYKLAEPVLLQLHADPNPAADVPYMLGAIAFDRGQLKKAIQLFRQALEINPSFVDAGVGLSVLLNDLGRYDEAKEVFDQAYTAMKKRSSGGAKDATLDEKLALKHAELGDLYFINSRYEEAEHEFEKAVKLASDVKSYAQKLEETRLKMEKVSDSVAKELENSLNDKYFKDLTF